MTKGQLLVNALADQLVETFNNNKMATREWFVKEIRRKYPQLDIPTLDLTVGMWLNNVVNQGILQRIRGKFYTPGNNYCKNKEI
jgi:hypothetical protein